MKVLRAIAEFFRNLFRKKPAERVIAVKRKDFKAFLKSYRLDRMRPHQRAAAIEQINKSRRFFS